MRHMKAQPLFYRKRRLADGSIVEMVIWQLPQIDAERPHGLKYRLYYGKDGRRLVCYDNERGKGDHRHIRDQELPYRFESVNQLMADFLVDVKQIRSEER
jgi:hypothetical protein